MNLQSFIRTQPERYGHMISRDPFARVEIHRETVSARGRECDWCGQRRRSGKLFRYRIEHDGGRIERVPGLFDAIDCMRAYHGH